MAETLGEEWEGDDAANLYSFLSGATGKKLLQRLKHSVYIEIMDTNKKTEWDDGRRSGMASLILGIENLSVIDDFESEEEEETE